MNKNNNCPQDRFEDCHAHYQQDFLTAIRVLCLSCQAPTKF